MKTILFACVCLCGLTSQLIAQRCDSINAALSSGWKPAKTAPHNGTIVEMMQTYGVAPWYGIFRWTRVIKSQTGTFKLPKPTWVAVDRIGHYVDEDACLFWRPYRSIGKFYVDPTGGAQNSIAYWCAAVRMHYDEKTDRCK